MNNNLAKIFSFCWYLPLLLCLTTVVTNLFIDSLCGRFVGRFDFFFLTHSVLKSFRPLEMTSVFWELPSPSGGIFRIDHQCDINISSSFSKGKILLHLSVNNFCIAVSFWVWCVCSWKIVQRLSHHLVLIGIHDHLLMVTGNAMLLCSISQFSHDLIWAYEIDKAGIISILCLKMLAQNTQWLNYLDSK